MTHSPPGPEPELSSLGPEPSDKPFTVVACVVAPVSEELDPDDFLDLICVALDSVDDEMPNSQGSSRNQALLHIA